MIFTTIQNNYRGDEKNHKNHKRGKINGIKAIHSMFIVQVEIHLVFLYEVDTNLSLCKKRHSLSQEIDTIHISLQFTGLGVDKAKDAIMQHARDLNVGGHMTSPRQFDWLISRQRYWGTPIPMINCPQCKVRET